MRLTFDVIENLTAWLGYFIIKLISGILMK